MPTLDVVKVIRKSEMQMLYEQMHGNLKRRKWIIKKNNRWQNWPGNAHARNKNQKTGAWPFGAATA